MSLPWMLCVAACLGLSQDAAGQPRPFYQAFWRTPNPTGTSLQGFLLFETTDGLPKRLPAFGGTGFSGLGVPFRRVSMQYQSVWAEQLGPDVDLPSWLERFDRQYRKAGGLVTRQYGPGRSSAVVRVTRLSARSLRGLKVAPPDRSTPLPEDGSRTVTFFVIEHNGVAFWSSWDIRGLTGLMPVSRRLKDSDASLHLSVFPSRVPDKYLDDFRDLIGQRVSTSLQQRDDETPEDFAVRKAAIQTRRAVWDRVSVAEEVSLVVANLRDERKPISLRLRIGSKPLDRPTIALNSDKLRAAASGPVPLALDALIWSVLSRRYPGLKSEICSLDSGSARLTSEGLTGRIAIQPEECRAPVAKLLTDSGVDARVSNVGLAFGAGAPAGRQPRSVPGTLSVVGNLAQAIDHAPAVLDKARAVEELWYRSCLTVLAVKYWSPNPDLDVSLRRIEDRPTKNVEPYYLDLVKKQQFWKELAYVASKDSRLRKLKPNNSGVRAQLAASRNTIELNLDLDRGVWSVLRGHWVDLDRKLLEFFRAESTTDTDDEMKAGDYAKSAQRLRKRVEALRQRLEKEKARKP